MCAGTSRARLRREQHSPCGDQAQPTPASNALKLRSLVCIEIPHTVKVVAEEHAVFARGHGSAASPFRQIVANLLAGFQVERLLVRIKRVTDDDRVLQVPTVVALPFLMMILPKQTARRQEAWGITAFVGDTL